MHRFEEDDGEPVAVVRTLADFALALTLVVLMLIGTRSVAGSKPSSDVRAATARKGVAPPELQVLLQSNGSFQSATGSKELFDATTLASQWHQSHGDAAATIVLQFPPPTLATDLHGALLRLQMAFGTNLTRIDTSPQP
jgi:hypothetical protein